MLEKLYIFSKWFLCASNLSFRLVPEALGYLHIKEDMAVMLTKRHDYFLFKKNKKAPQISLRGFLVA